MDIWKLIILGVTHPMSDGPSDVFKVVQYLLYFELQEMFFEFPYLIITSFLKVYKFFAQNKTSKSTGSFKINGEERILKEDKNEANFCMLTFFFQSSFKHRGSCRRGGHMDARGRSVRRKCSYLSGISSACGGSGVGRFVYLQLSQMADG